MIDTVLKTIEKYKMIDENDVIIIGLSGGADSVALTHVLSGLAKKYSLKLIGVHVNHKLRGEEAFKDQQFVEELCKRLQIALEIFTCDVKAEMKKLRISEEEAGRLIRYKIFDDALKKYNGDKIAVAHNMNDNAETVLMRMCRGTGLKGLAGINAVRGNIIRPLINCERSVIEQYCNLNGIVYRTDATNLEATYTRNKIRLNMIPWIERELNKNIIGALAKVSGILGEENEFLDYLAKEALEKCLVSDERILLSIDELNKFDTVIKRRIIRLAYLNYSAGLHDISYEHINMVLSLLNGATGKTVDLPDGLRAQRQYGNILLYSQAEINNDFSYELPPDKVVFIEELQKKILATEEFENIDINYTNCYTKAFDYDRIKGNLQIRTRKPGDRIFLKGINGNKKVKNLFVDLKIPGDVRKRTPILCCEEDVIWVVGVRVSDLYIADENTKRRIYVQIWGD